MIRVTIKEQLKKQNRNLNWLSMETKITYSTLSNLANNKTESVKFEFIEKICIALNCTPSDIIEIVK